MLKILKGNDLPKTKCTPVLEVTPALRKFAAELMATMRLNNGVGLAANQVGRNIAVIVFDCVGTTFNAMDSGFLFNPEIIEQSAELIEAEEGCLSFPGEVVKIKRPKWIKVKFLNLRNEEVVQLYKGLAARILCHEIAHLNGLTMFDEG